MKTAAFKILGVVVSLFGFCSAVLAFEGTINALVIQNGQTNLLFYTVATNLMRVVSPGSATTMDVIELRSGSVTLFFPGNRSFTHLKPAQEDQDPPRPFIPVMPTPPSNFLPDGSMIPPGVGPQPRVMPTMPTMPVMPAMPTMPAPGQKLELEATGQKTNILGFACQEYVLKDRREILDIWATDQLLPYQPYIHNQPHYFGPRRLEEQWPALLTKRKLFPLLAILRSEKGPERFRFEVTSVVPRNLTEDDAKLFEPPPGYREIPPLPF
jgi:hypothetical protein